MHLLPAEKIKPRMTAANALQGKAAKPSIAPNVIRRFCAELHIAEKPAATVERRAVADAVKHWPSMIEASSLTGAQRRRLLAHFHSHPLVESLLRRERLVEAGR